MKKNPTIIPNIGVRMVNATIIKMPFDTNADEPNANHTGPMIPPSKACDEEIGNPSFVQIHIHEVAPVRAQNTTYGSM
jgi:hypothetical protein